MLSAITSIAYVHGVGLADNILSGKLPPYPDVERRNQLFVVLGKVHNQLDRGPAAAPQWLLKQDYQRAVLLRIPKMDTAAHP